MSFDQDTEWLDLLGLKSEKSSKPRAGVDVAVADAGFAVAAVADNAAGFAENAGVGVGVAAFDVAVARVLKNYPKDDFRALGKIQKYCWWW
mmetsp:Transcript_24200/g.47570  ORF Transcript_24200/g.47570 Transcript_24200/m.47570 type:complete len:91 (+) Transcript_24200:1302-1574(+)